MLSVLACDAPDGWSDLRSALTGAGGGDGLVALVQAKEGELTHELADPVPGGASDIGTSWVRTIDRARALVGRDALVAAAYSIIGDRVTARTCGALTLALPRYDRSFVTGAGWSDLERTRLARLGSRLAGWLAACGDDGRASPIVVAPGRGMPALVAWVPDRGTLLVHPATLDVLGAADARVDTTVAALIGEGTDCRADLDAWCARCTTAAEPGCEPLFGPLSDFQTCADIDADFATSASAALSWRELYCAWRDLVADPRARWWVFGVDFARGEGSPPCWDRRLRVSDGGSLAAAFAGWDAACEGELERARQVIASSGPFGSTGTGQMPRPDPGETVSECGARIRDVTCEACIPDPRALCGSFFPGSTMPQDCSDLARAESHGGAFGAACTYGAAFAFVDRSCFNAYDQCWSGFAGGTEGLSSFEALVASAPGFFDAATAERCVAQAERCFAGDPLHDFDEGAPFPGTPSEPPRAAAEEDKCPL